MSDPTRRAARHGAVTQKATELSVPIGPRVMDVLDLAYRARRPVLLEGPTGIGKSQVVAQFAAQSGLDVTVLDLSLLEPPDLVGLPVIEGGRTRYASPAELPTEGRGVLLLEELNRAEIPVMQPALQLLSARRLHSYTLPPGWTCVAAVNPDDGDYHVHELDPALRSRFLQLAVHADRGEWLRWARRANVYPAVLAVVDAHDDAFSQAPPRSWAYASEVLHEARASELEDRDLLRAVLRGYLPTPWAMRLTDALSLGVPALSVDIDALFEPGGDALLAQSVKSLDARDRPDAVSTLSAKLRRVLGGEAFAARVSSGAMNLAGLERLVAPLPGDLRAQCLETAAESPAARALLASAGHDPEGIQKGYVGSALQREVRQWRKDALTHRVRLAVVAARRGIDDAGDLHPSPALAALAEDAGPLGDDLARRLRQSEVRG